MINLETSDKAIKFLPRTKFLTDLRLSAKLVGAKSFKHAVSLEIHNELT